MDQTFIDKYKPQSIDDFFLDDVQKKIINKCIHTNNIRLFFSGSSGSGKTSILRIISNNYTNEDNILITSNLKDQGINYFKNDVKMFCKTSSTIKNKKKILLIDDIDNMNEQTQYIIKSYIEKFNNIHVLISCTNIRKVIDGIQSRFLIFKLNLPSYNNMYELTKKISKIEQIDITEETHNFIIKICNHNINNILCYLEKFKLYNGPIKLKIATNMCTNIDFTLFDELIDLIILEFIDDAIILCRNIYSKGNSVMDVLDSFYIYIKNTSKISENSKYQVIPVLCKYITIFNNMNEDEIELTLFIYEISKILS